MVEWVPGGGRGLVLLNILYIELLIILFLIKMEYTIIQLSQKLMHTKLIFYTLMPHHQFKYVALCANLVYV